MHKQVYAIYVHIPFCVKRCSYCDFSTAATAKDSSVPERYVQALLRQIQQCARLGLLDTVKTVYIGGGTPSFLGEKLVDLVRVLAQIGSIEELSCEANPESFTAKLADGLARAGATRISLGVQSLVDKELHALGRVHSAATARRAIGYARTAGLEISGDLMCGIPLQTASSWRYSLQELVACGVHHVSVYPLSIEEHTRFWDLCMKGSLAWPDADVQAQMMTTAQSDLEAQGFAHYEVASYAKDRRWCQHNLAYWTGKPYMAFGTASAAMLSRESYEQLRQIAPQLCALANNIARVRLQTLTPTSDFLDAQSLADMSYDLELLTPQQSVAEDLMLATRTSFGISSALYTYARHVLGKTALDRALLAAEKQGLLRKTSNHGFVPTQSGWLLGNQLYGLLWDLAESPVAQMQTGA